MRLGPYPERVGAQVEDGGSAGAAGDVAEALAAVLASEPFRRSPRSGDLLSYVVSETLAGRADRLSERTVARGALGRGPDFDSRSDSLVRVTATRVRRALDDYYAGEGARDTVRIALPPGRYVPAVDRSGVLVREPGPVPGVGVLLPDVAGSEEAQLLATSLADVLVLSLSQHDILRVVGPSAAQPDSAAWARRTGLSHVLDGRVSTHEGTARLVTRLVTAKDGVVAWSDAREARLDDPFLLRTVESWARQIAHRAATIGGVVLAEAAPTAGPELHARAAYYLYLERGTREATREAIDALDEALGLGPRTASLLAMRGAVANALVLQGDGDPEGDTALAEELAREALTLDSGSAHAYLVLAGAARARGRWTTCQQCARTAAVLAPQHPAFLLTAGFLIEVSGAWEEGMALIEDALALDPRLPVYVRLYLAVGHVALGDYERALAEATLIDVEGEVFGPFYRALAVSGLGEIAAARHEVERLLAVEPDFFERIESTLRADFRFTEEQLARVLGLLDQARTPDGSI